MPMLEVGTSVVKMLKRVQPGTDLSDTVEVTSNGLDLLPASDCQKFTRITINAPSKLQDLLERLRGRN